MTDEKMLEGACEMLIALRKFRRGLVNPSCSLHGIEEEGQFRALLRAAKSEDLVIKPSSSSGMTGARWVNLLDPSQKSKSYPDGLTVLTAHIGKYDSGWREQVEWEIAQIDGGNR